MVQNTDSAADRIGMSAKPAFLSANLFLHSPIFFADKNHPLADMGCNASQEI